jgi:hypothetical protein
MRLAVSADLPSQTGQRPVQWQVVHGFREWGPSLAVNDPTPLHLEQRPLSLHDLQDVDAISGNPPFCKVKNSQ